MKELLSLCPKKLHCPVSLETLGERTCAGAENFVWKGVEKIWEMFERMHAWKLFYFYQFQAIKKWKNCAGAGECANIKNWHAEFCKAIYWKKISDIEASWYTLWQYGLWNFQMGYTKLERLLHKNQHTQRKLLNFENWTNGEPQ